MSEQGSHTPPDILSVKINFCQKVEYQNFLKNNFSKTIAFLHFTAKPWNNESPITMENLQNYQRRKKPSNSVF